MAFGAKRICPQDYDSPFWFNRHEFMSPKELNKAKNFRVAAIDIESKDEDSTTIPGFSRPFLVCVQGPDGFSRSFRDANNSRLGRHWRDWPYLPGGCVDLALRYILNSEDFRATKYKACGETVDPCVIYAHNGGAFDFCHLEMWFTRIENRAIYATKIIPSGSSMIELQVSERLRPVNGHHPHPEYAGVVEHRLDKTNTPVCINRKTECPGCEMRAVISGNLKGNKWIFRDSLRLMTTSLASVAKMLKIDPKKDMNLHTPECDAKGRPNKIWEEYCLHDCSIVVQAVESVKATIEEMGGEVGMTAPSTALKLFQAKYQTQAFSREPHFHDCPDVCQVCHRETCIKKKGEKPCLGEKRQLQKKYRPPRCPTWPLGCAHHFVFGSHQKKESKHASHGTMKGGRTEVIRHSSLEKNLNYFDINSSYPFAMTQPMPVGGQRVAYGNFTLDQIAVMLEMTDGARKGYALPGLSNNMGEKHPRVGFVECVVHIPKDCYFPPLVVQRGGKLLAPVGTFYGRFDYAELKGLARVGGHVVRTNRVVSWEGKPVLKSFAETLYDERRAVKRTNPVRAEVLKLLLNAGGFGKYSQNPERTGIEDHFVGDPVPRGHLPTSPNVNSIDFDPRDWHLMYSTEYSETAHFIPHIAAHLTSLARAYLWNVIMDLLDRGHKVYMLDTDSVITDGLLPEHLVGDALGQLKNEFPYMKFGGEFLRPKEYRLTAADGHIFEGYHLADENGKNLCNNGDLDVPKEQWCKGCDNSIRKFKSIPRRYQSAKNFDILKDGGKIFLTQTPKVGTLAAVGFATYQIRTIEKGHRAVYAAKRLRIEGDPEGNTRPIFFKLGTRFNVNPSDPAFYPRHLVKKKEGATEITCAELLDWWDGKIKRLPLESERDD